MLVLFIEFRSVIKRFLRSSRTTETPFSNAGSDTKTRKARKADIDEAITVLKNKRC